MRKIILNKSHGGFLPSMKAYREYAMRKGMEAYRYDFVIGNTDADEPKYIKSDKWDEDGSLFSLVLTRDHGNVLPFSLPEDVWNDRMVLGESMREDPDLVAVVEELGDGADSKFSRLVVVEVPNKVAKDYVIDNYDGIETLHRRVREW